MSRDPSPKPADGHKPDGPPLAAEPTCPNCGHRPAVVFPVLTDGKKDGAHKLVCPLCCPKRDHHS
jgi:hypothetical protein